MRTKWEILEQRRDNALEVAKRIQGELDWMERTEFGFPCACGTHLQTEKDFAQHFEIPDERLLNLGGCPVKRKERESAVTG